MIAPPSTTVSYRKLYSWVSRTVFIAILAFSGCTTERIDEQGKQMPQERVSTPSPVYKEVGKASWYGPGFHGNKTANGETFNQNKLTAAHRRLPLGTKAEVTNLENGKKVEVKINDRGPYVDNRSIDLSRAAAKKLNMEEDGTAKVKIEVKRHPSQDSDKISQGEE